MMIDKNEYIQDYCSMRSDKYTDPCSGCPVDTICMDIMGCFDNKPEHTNKAYEIIKNVTEGDNLKMKDDHAGHNAVEHPSHYCREGAMECIDEMVMVFGVKATITFCLMNVFKYRYRAGDKNGEQDVKKSDMYMKIAKDLMDKNGIESTISIKDVRGVELVKM